MTRHAAYQLAAKPAAAALAVALFGAGPAAAQDDGQVSIDANRCAELASPDERLACYEDQIEAASGEREEQGRPESAPPGDAQAEPPEILATVASLREREPNQYVITLENGQVWYQTVPRRYPQLRTGTSVRLYATPWGPSYRLTVEDRGYIQVERVR